MLLEAAESAEVGSVRVAVNNFYEPLFEWLGHAATRDLIDVLECYERTLELSGGGD